VCRHLVLSDPYWLWIRNYNFQVLRTWFGRKLTSLCLQVFRLHKFLLICYIIAQASVFSAPGAVGGLPEERGGAAEEVATGSGTHSGSSAPAPAQFHLGEVNFSGSIRFVGAGPHLLHRC
jgi:hypothetical protein